MPFAALATGLVLSAVMARSRIVALSVALSMAAACGSVAPTAPSPPSSALGLTLQCSAPTVLAGETVVCMLRANSVNAGLTAVWTSSAPSVATSEGIRSLRGEVRRPDDTHCNVFRSVLVGTLDGAFARQSYRVGGGARRQFQGWHHRHHVAARGLWGVVRRLRQTDARCHGLNRFDHQHKRTANTCARRRQIPHLHHIHPAARHHACVSDGRPSDRIRHADRGSGRVTRTLHCSNTVIDAGCQSAFGSALAIGNV